MADRTPIVGAGTCGVIAARAGNSAPCLLPAHVARALAGKGGDTIARIAPPAGDRFLFKGAYSAFDGTPLLRLLDYLGVMRVVLAGAATEMCVAQTGSPSASATSRVSLLSDACATVDPANERIALEYLEHVGGSVIRSVARWRRGAAVEPGAS